jgi:hypothetical protein
MPRPNGMRPGESASRTAASSTPSSLSSSPPSGGTSTRGGGRVVAAGGGGEGATGWRGGASWDAGAAARPGADDVICAWGRCGGLRALPASPYQGVSHAICMACCMALHGVCVCVSACAPMHRRGRPLS